MEYLNQVPDNHHCSKVFDGCRAFTTYIYVFKSESAIEMHERGIVISKCRVPDTYHCVTPSSSSALSQKLSPPGDKQHLHPAKAFI